MSSTQIVAFFPHRDLAQRTRVRSSSYYLSLIEILSSYPDPPASFLSRSGLLLVVFLPNDPGSRAGKLPGIPRHFWARTYLAGRALEPAWRAQGGDMSSPKSDSGSRSVSRPAIRNHSVKTQLRAGQIARGKKQGDRGKKTIPQEEQIFIARNAKGRYGAAQYFGEGK